MHELGIAQKKWSRSSPHTPRARSRASCSRSASCRPFCPTRSGFASTCAARVPWSTGAQLEIIEIPGRARCRACGGEVMLERPFGRCRMRRHRPRMVVRRRTQSQRIRGVRCVKPVVAPTIPSPSSINLQSGLTIAIGTATDRDHEHEHSHSRPSRRA